MSVNCILPVIYIYTEWIVSLCPANGFISSAMTQFLVSEFGRTDTWGHVFPCLLLLVVSLHFSHPLFDTSLCRFIVMYQIYIWACLSQQRALEEMFHVCSASWHSHVVSSSLYPHFRMLCFASAHPSAQSVQAHPFWPRQCRTTCKGFLWLVQ